MLHFIQKHVGNSSNSDPETSQWSQQVTVAQESVWDEIKMSHFDPRFDYDHF